MEIELDRLVDTLPGLVWTSLPDGEVDFVNQRWSEYTGMRLDEAVGSGWLCVIHAEDLPHLLERWNSILTSGQPGEVEGRLRRHDGAYRWFNFSASPILDPSGEIARWCGINTDIDDRKRAEEAQSASERNLKLIINTLPTTAWSTDASGNVDFLSDRWLDYAGFTAEQGAGLGWGAVIHPDDAPGLFQNWRSCLETGVPADFEARMRRSDGEYRWFLFRANPLRDSNGAIIKWYGTNFDIEDRKHTEALVAIERQWQSEQALGEVRSQLARMARVTALGALTASIAHEVNQPLSGIITNASTCLKMLSSEPPNVGGAQETARRMIRDGNRAADVIKRLRALFARDSAAREALDLSEAARELITLSVSDLQRRHVIVRSALADGLPSVTGDRVQLQQVILNLLLNAADSMNAVEDRPRQVSVTTRQEDANHVSLAVSDVGIGLDPDSTERLFEAFYTTKSEGMGIGLSVSRSIVESHGGRLTVRSNDGPGVTFTFTLPVKFDATTIQPDRTPGTAATDPGL